MNILPFVAVICGPMLLGACATDVTLHYVPSAVYAQAASGPAIGTVTATDERGEDGHYLGTIRGGFGNPLKTIRTSDLVSDQVVSIFRDALRARGLLAETGQAPFDLALRITRMDVNQVARREANVNFVIAVRDRAGSTVYQDAVSVQRINGSLISFDVGVLASPDDLRALLGQTVDEATDQALNKLDASINLAFVAGF